MYILYDLKKYCQEQPVHVQFIQKVCNKFHTSSLKLCCSCYLLKGLSVALQYMLLHIAFNELMKDFHLLGCFESFLHQFGCILENIRNILSPHLTLCIPNILSGSEVLIFVEPHGNVMF